MKIGELRQLIREAIRRPVSGVAYVNVAFMKTYDRPGDNARLADPGSIVVFNEDPRPDVEPGWMPIELDGSPAWVKDTEVDIRQLPKFKRALPRFSVSMIVTVSMTAESKHHLNRLIVKLKKAGWFSYIDRDPDAQVFRLNVDNMHHVSDKNWRETYEACQEALLLVRTLPFMISTVINVDSVTNFTSIGRSRRVASMTMDDGEDRWTFYDVDGHPVHSNQG